MSIFIVQRQMIMIFVMILIGVYLYKSSHLSNLSAQHISWIIVNITNPITLLCAALKDDNKIGATDIGIAFLCFTGMYLFFIALGYLIPLLLGVERERRYEYRMITIFGNVGFIGIPFAQAVLGISSLIYVAICGLCFNFIMYTYGFHELRSVAEATKGEMKHQLHIGSVVNTGTVMAVVTLVVYLVDVQVPEGVGTLLSYMGNCTTFLSMIVLGVSVAQMVPKKVFGNWRLYAFVGIRQIGVPIVVALVLKALGIHGLMLQTIAIMSAMPVANMPLMVAKQFGVPEETISAGIILTTLATIVTIPLVIGVL